MAHSPVQFSMVATAAAITESVSSRKIGFN